ncbi:MAG: radical SAM protein [Deltaproteobacteria bacterium]|nr:radical SAM protein [Deltaproteobacteria bacterium]
MLLTLRNSLVHLGTRDPLRWHPLLAVYYLTYACNYRCPYCSDGTGTPYYRLASPVLSAPEVLRVLATIRRYADFLVLTGGEPLRYPALNDVLRGLPSLGFDGVVLTTIGDDVERHLTLINEAVKHLVFSLDTLDAAKADRWLGAGPGAHARILGQIERARTFPGRRYEIIISSVATEDNLADLYDVYEYASSCGFRFALCPQLLGVKAPARFDGDPEYRRLFDFLIARKRRGGKVHGTVAYLEHMRDLSKFLCRPSTVLAVSPVGDVFYPCLEIGRVAGNLLSEPDLDRIRAAGREQIGPEPSCDTRCHSACALGLSLAFNHPASVLREAMLAAKAGLRR